MNFFMGVSLEPVSEVDGDQICVGLIRPVEKVRALTFGAALLEVQSEFGCVHEPVAAAIPDAEADSATGIVGARVEENSFGWGSHVIEFFAIGTAVIGGMLTATILAIFYIPLFYVLVRRGARGHAR